jgi:hypothetical protein
MHVHLRRSSAVTLLAAAAAVLPSACAKDDSSIFIAGVLLPTASSMICTYTPQATPTFLLRGTIDAAFAGEYVGVLQVENQLVARGNPNTLKTETSYVQLYDAEVQVLDPTQSMAVLKQYSVPVSGFLPVGMAGQPGLGASSVVMVDAATVQAKGAQAGAPGGLEQQVVSSVVLRGRTLGGLEVHTQEFLFPISISYATSCTTTPGTACVGGMSTTSSTLLCTPGQDGSLSCQQVAASLGVCGRLECDLLAGKSLLASAHCPAHSPVDDSCCHP